MRIGAIAFFLSIAALPSIASAQERDYCPDRPGIGTPACTIDPGKFSLEVGLGDWTMDRTAEQREDVFLAGDVLLRYGVADHAEVQLGWTSLGFSRTRDRTTGAVDHRSGTGDVTLALRRNLLSPDGSGLSVAVMPFVSLPVGREPFGAGDWGAGVNLPLSYEISDSWSLVTTSTVAAAVDEDGNGRHLAFGEAIGGAVKLNDDLTATAEYQITVDHDPERHHVEHLAGLSLGWQPQDDLQLDIGANAGLDADVPDVELYFGVSRRF